MFGLKVVNKKGYLHLQDELNLYMKVIAEKEAIIANLEGEIKGLHSTIDHLEKKVETLEAPKTSDTILITDVAEEPLVIEKKPTKRVKATKTTSGTIKRKKIVRKTDVGE